MREPIREPTPQEARVERGTEPLRYPRPIPVSEAAPYLYRGLVEWGPTWGGMFVALGVLILLSTLGVAIGVGAGSTAAGIWGAISVIIGFFVGGWFAGRTLDVFDSLVAAAHGLLVWAVSLIFTLIFAITAAFAGLSSLANAARAATLTNLAGLTSFGTTAVTPNAAAAAGNAVVSSWVGFIVLLLSVAAAVIGAIVANRGRYIEPVTRP